MPNGQTKFDEDAYCLSIHNLFFLSLHPEQKRDIATQKKADGVSYPPNCPRNADAAHPTSLAAIFLFFVQRSSAGVVAEYPGTTLTSEDSRSTIYTGKTRPSFPLDLVTSQGSSLVNEDAPFEEGWGGGERGG